MFRVLVVDDSSVARELLKDILASDPDIDIVGVAENGRQAVELARRLSPDLITMDLHMPEMSGLEAIQEIMCEHPTPIIVVSASLSAVDVDKSMLALRAGALSVRLKPPGPDSPNFNVEAVSLIEAVKTMADVKVVRHRRQRLSPDQSKVTMVPPPRIEVPQAAQGKVFSGPAISNLRAIVLAASTGGPPALQAILGGLAADFPLPILVVQHITHNFVTGFAAWLDKVTKLNVHVGTDGEPLLPGTVYVAPPDRHLGVTSSKRIAISSDPPIDGFRPAATHTIRSAAEAFDGAVITFVLTGMGRDGAAGVETLHQKGGVTCVQDEASCVVYGMPAAVVNAGLADAILPPSQMAQLLKSIETTVSEAFRKSSK